MAAAKNMTDIKLQVIVENGTTASGKKATKNISFNQIKLTASDNELLDAGKAAACAWSIPMTSPMQDKK